MITNKDQWLEIRLYTNDHLNETILEDALFATGALSVTLESLHDEAILVEPIPGDHPLWEKGSIVIGLYEKNTNDIDIINKLQKILNTKTLPLIKTNHFVDKVWETEWSKHFQPIAFSNDLWICPSTHSVPDPKAKVITLDPGLAFGTGTHPTTAMVIEYLATHPNTYYHVIDYGCGSGILGIAAIKMGATHCIMTDIDPKALVTTNENCILNQVEQQVEIYLPEKVPALKTDLLIANILLEPLLLLEPTLRKLCHNQTRIILTGLLKEQVDTLISCYQKDFTNFSIVYKDEWAMVYADVQSVQCVS